MRKAVTTLIALLFIVGLLVGASQTDAQTKTTASPIPVVAQPTPEPSSMFLEYTKFLRDETTAHREFLEKFYTLTSAAFGGIILFFGGVLTWLNWKTKKDIHDQVNELFKVSVEKEIEVRVGNLYKSLDTAREDVDSKVGEINRMLLELSQKTTQPSIEKPQVDVAKLKGKLILWVDDRPQGNRHARRILEEAGVRFNLDLSTEDAIKTLEKNRFKYDLIISDMGRGADSSAGLEFLTRLKEKLERHRKEIPVIIYSSAQAVEKYGKQAKELGALHVVNGESGLLKYVFNTLAGIE